ncbi:carboxyl transferase domain-containing protein [Lactiplantibacillus plantarum]
MQTDVEKLIFDCPRCKQTLDIFRVGDLKTCPFCNYAFRLSYIERLSVLKADFKEWKIKKSIFHPVSKRYKEKITEVRTKTGLNDSLIIGEAIIDHNNKIALGIFDCTFMMGSFGTLVGEKMRLLFEKATAKSLPVVLFCASGGARMQESPVSLLQMQKMNYFAGIFRKNGGFLISVLCDPCMGGALASIANCADVVLAETGAQIGFAGLKVIQNTIGKKVSIQSQLAETVYNNGFIDSIVQRKSLPNLLNLLLNLHGGKLS